MEGLDKVCCVCGHELGMVADYATTLHVDEDDG